MKKQMRTVLALALSVLCAVSCFSVPAALALTSGDVDGSGKVNSSDARLALRAAARIESLTDEQFAAADVDGNGKVNATDARKILRAAARIEALPQAGPVAQHDAWVLIDTRVEEHRQPDTATDFFNYDASPGQHFCSMAHEFGDGSSVSAAYRGTCTPMPAEIGAGERVSAELRLWITEASGDDKGGHYTVEASLSRDVPGLKYDTYTEDRVPFTAAQSGGADRCIVDSPDIYNKEPNDTEYARVSCVFPAGSPGEQWCVYFIACGCETVWTYEWQRVGKDEPSSTEPSTEPTTEPGGDTTVIRR
ncbi:MAG: dockerin type I repeat-containing protein, partial [Clostridia bacterium]|nr:dockerin type I repeat-containing protein [Clostridia bacterium]